MDRAKQLTKRLLEAMGIVAEVDVKEENGVVHININSDDSGLLIGYHGELLQSLQLILGLMLNRETKEWQQILVDIGDYRQQRQNTLLRMAARAARRARELGEEQELPAMPPFERRVVHLAIASEEGVVSESRGERYNRRVIVKAKGQ